MIPSLDPHPPAYRTLLNRLMAMMTAISAINSRSTRRLSIFLFSIRPMMPPPMPQMAPAVLASRLTRKKISVILSPFHTLSVKGAVSSPCSSLGTAGGVIQVPKALLNAYFGKICQNSI